MKQNPIGIFDSGIGGLTVLAALQQALPEESYCYVADTQRAPYGDRSLSDLTQINNEIITFLTQQNIKALVFACNTSCAVVLPHLTLNIPNFELISAAAAAAVSGTQNQHIGVLATQQTTQSKAYEKAIHKIKPNIKVENIACPALVPLVEKGLVNTAEAKQKANEYLSQTGAADTVILGCSHYPYFLPHWESSDKTFLNPADAIALATLKGLKELDLCATTHNPSLDIYTSGKDQEVKDCAATLGLTQTLNTRFHPYTIE